MNKKTVAVLIAVITLVFAASCKKQCYGCGCNSAIGKEIENMYVCDTCYTGGIVDECNLCGELAGNGEHVADSYICGGCINKTASMLKYSAKI